MLFAGSVGSRLCYVYWEPTNNAVNRVCEFILRLRTDTRRMCRLPNDTLEFIVQQKRPCDRMLALSTERQHALIDQIGLVVIDTVSEPTQQLNVLLERRIGKQFVNCFVRQWTLAPCLYGHPQSRIEVQHQYGAHSKRRRVFHTLVRVILLAFNFSPEDVPSPGVYSCRVVLAKCVDRLNRHCLLKAVGRDFNFACPGWTHYPPESRRAHGMRSGCS